MQKLTTRIETAIKQAAPALMQAGKAEEISKIKEMLGVAVNSPTTLLVCGEFKRGKSTFVNALIGRNICATDTDICTSVVSIIRYGDKESVVRFFGDFSNPRKEEISLEDLERYTVGSADEIDNTIYVDITLPLVSLKNLVIIDTPGVGGLDPRHATLTNYFLPKADIALFVTDVNEPLTTTELKYLCTKVLPYARHTAVVVNKSDLRDKEDVEDFRLDTINKIASDARINKEELQVVAVSSAAEAYPDSDLGESNFAELREMVDALSGKHKETIISSIAANLQDILDVVIKPLQAQLDQIEHPDVDQIDGLNKQKASLEKKLTELSDPNSHFRTTVAKAITESREEIMNYINESSVILQSEVFQKLLHSEEAHSESGGQWMGRKLNDAIAEIGSEVSIMLDQSFESIAAMPEFEGMLDFEIKDYTSHIIIRSVDTSVPINKRLTPMMSGLGIASFGTMIATGFLGVVAALGIGAYVAFRNQKDAGNMHVENNLRQVYQPQLSGAINSLNTYVNTRFSEFQQEWLGVITDRCKTYKTSVQEAIGNIQQVQQQVHHAVNLKMQVQSKLRPLLAAKDTLNKSDI